MSEEIVDLPEVMERVLEDKHLLLELFDLFQRDFVIKRGMLTEAIAIGDFEKIRDVAHFLKGSSGNISAKSIFASCEQLGRLARAKTTDGMAEVVRSMDEQFIQLKAFAARLKKEWGAA